jgi:hypothetical protein
MYRARCNDCRLADVSTGPALRRQGGFAGRFARVCPPGTAREQRLAYDESWLTSPAYFNSPRRAMMFLSSVSLVAMRGKF